jgi:hypothetical protein
MIDRPEQLVNPERDAPADPKSDQRDSDRFVFTTGSSLRKEKPGIIGFDELGNAQYRWRDQSLLEDGDKADTRRQRALSFANLVLVDDEPAPDIRYIQDNKRGIQQGYNPYNSGKLEKKERRKPRDLRALSKWIEARNRPPQSDEPDDK